MLDQVLVSHSREKKEFLDFPARLYQQDPNYIRPLDKDVEAVFDPSKNKFFDPENSQRFLFKQNGKTVGRVAVFINNEYQQEQPTGGFGFFDCIDEQSVANEIFDFAKNWMIKKGMQAMDGPINLGERDKFWGVLIEGFSEPLYGMNYNAPYYQTLFENYGFKIYYRQLCFTRSVHGEVSRVFTIMHSKYKKDKDFSTKPLTKNRLEIFAKEFTEIYNKAWAAHEDNKQIEEANVLKMFKTLKPVLNEHISWFVYHQGKPIAFWMNIADLNQWFKYLNGKFGWWQKLKLLCLKNFKKNTKMVGLVFGVVPEWQKKGVEGYMIYEGTLHLRQHTDFEVTEMQWIGDFNPKMIKIAENLDAKVTRQLATYRLLFDQSKAFKKHPEL